MHKCRKLCNSQRRMDKTDYYIKIDNEYTNAINKTLQDNGIRTRHTHNKSCTIQVHDYIDYKMKSPRTRYPSG